MYEVLPSNKYIVHKQIKISAQWDGPKELDKDRGNNLILVQNETVSLLISF